MISANLYYVSTAPLTPPIELHAGHDCWEPVSGLVIGRLRPRSWVDLEQWIGTQAEILPHVLDPVASLGPQTLAALAALKITVPTPPPAGGYAIAKWLSQQLKWPPLHPVSL